NKAGFSTQGACTQVAALPFGDMVFFCGKAVAGNTVFLQVDGLVANRDAARTHQFVVQVKFPQVIVVGRSGNIGAIGIPVEQWADGLLLAATVIVNHIRPEQFVFTKQVKCQGQVTPVQVAFILDAGGDTLKNGFVDKHAEIPRAAEIQQGGQVACGMKVMGHNGCSGSEDSAADAVSGGMEPFFTGDGGNGFSRCDDALLDVVCKSNRGMLAPGVDPGNTEYGKPLLHHPLNQ